MIQVTALEVSGNSLFVPKIHRCFQCKNVQIFNFESELQMLGIMRNTRINTRDSLPIYLSISTIRKTTHRIQMDSNVSSSTATTNTKLSECLEECMQRQKLELCQFLRIQCHCNDNIAFIEIYLPSLPFKSDAHTLIHSHYIVISLVVGYIRLLLVYHFA